MRGFRGLYRLMTVASTVDWLRAASAFFLAGGGSAVLAFFADVPWWGFIPIGLGVGTLVAAGVVAIYQAQPRLVFLDPEVDETSRILGFEPHETEVVYLAKVAVRNERQTGEEAIARAVTPELDIFAADGDEHLTHYVGWSTEARRDFQPTREEAHIFVAKKINDWQHEDRPYALRGAPDGMREIHGRCVSVDVADSDRLVGERFVVRVTLRGLNFKPVKAKFALINEPGGGIKFERLD